MSEQLLDLLAPATGGDSGRMYGVVIGLVTSNQDPDGLGRVKVKFPWLSEDEESWWARIAVGMAGPSRGTYFLPEVDDEVLVAFEHGDPSHPYVIGALWNGKDKPPESNGDGENNVRVIRSRSGHVIRLDDKQGDERIEIVDPKGNGITIKSSDDSITIRCDNGKLKLSAMEIEIVATTGVKIEANTTIDVKAAAPLTLKGAVVNIN